MITIKSTGSFKKTQSYLNNLSKLEYKQILEYYGRVGLDALSSATPIDDGLTAQSWTFDVEFGKESTFLIWSNTNVNDGVSVAILIQYGHGTGTGGYVQGRDYINPAIHPIFDQISKDLRKQVRSAH